MNMNTNLKLYRKRFIPDETIYLKDDQILYNSPNLLVTKWMALKPRPDISYGYSAYFLDQGFKISKVYNEKKELVYWYCDIITHQYDSLHNSLTITDLIIDIVIKENGDMNILDLDELADCIEHSDIPKHLVIKALRNANKLLNIIATNQFNHYQEILSSYEKNNISM